MGWLTDVLLMVVLRFQGAYPFFWGELTRLGIRADRGYVRFRLLFRCSRGVAYGNWRLRKVEAEEIGID